MKNYTLFILIAFIISCQSTIYEKPKIDNIDLSIDLKEEDLTQSILLYHLYFENHNNKDESIGVNYHESGNNLKVSLFPGVYNIYAYGLIEKTNTSKKVYSFSIEKNIKCFDNSDILINLKTLAPQAEIVIIENLPVLKVNMNDLYEIFYLSSLSIKQGGDRVRSLDYSFNNNDKSYIANVPLYENGDWYFNISYCLKSKIDKDILNKDNVDISTSYFSSIYLGNYQLIKD